MKPSFWLLPALLLLISQYVPSLTYAQTQPPTDSIQLQVRSAGDTLRAIHQLFLHKRQSAKEVTRLGVGMAAVGILIAGASYALVNSVKKTTSGKPLEQGVVSVSLTYSLPGLAITTLGLIRRVRFKRQREVIVVSAYEQSKGLPRSIQRSIKPQHFAN